MTELQDMKSLKNILFLLSPSEIITDKTKLWPEILEYVKGIFFHEYQLPFYENEKHFLQQHFKVSTLSGFGIDRFSVGIKAAAQLLSYSKDTQKTDLSHIKKISCYQFTQRMILDEMTVRNLELLNTARDFKREGSLLSLVDRTLTRMGARKIRQWLLSPLTNKEQIDFRLDAVHELIAGKEIRRGIQQELKEFFDLERLCGKIGCGFANARDLNFLRVNLLKIPVLKSLLKENKNAYLVSIEKNLDMLKGLIDLIHLRVAEDPPPMLTEGGIIADGFSKELDELRNILKTGKSWLMDYQQKLRSETGIQTLKVKFNKLFGYHIEVSKAQSSKVPSFFQLKQNLLNDNRYMTEELHQFAEQFLNAEEKIKGLERQLFSETITEVIPFLEKIQKNADLISSLDVLYSFSQLALEEHYCRPEITEQREIHILEGRHAVIEHFLKKDNKIYISNNTSLNEQHQIMLLTGPNMAGKSSYLRQVALIALMAHMGSFIPAKSARIGIIDRIFTRVGASDDISSGKSTFMVEMTEAANILHNATDRALIIFDELGRGTSTYDGVSIAWSILEHIAKEMKSLTLFATHYHELIDVVKDIPNANNYSIAVAERDGEVIFLRKIIDRGVDRSYGIEVAKLAGLPDSIVSRAKKILEELERDRLKEEQTIMSFQIEQSPHRKIIDALKKINPHETTPLQALQFLSEIKKDL